MHLEGRDVADDSQGGAVLCVVVVRDVRHVTIFSVLRVTCPCYFVCVFL